MNTLKFRALRADEVEARVSTINEKGLMLLLYKDARCDMRLLDETVGPARWKRSHYEMKGNLFCSVSIEFDGVWVNKDDCGTESYTEKEKGEASDSFKRACFNWGIGRELYTGPFIWVPAVDKQDNKPNYTVIDKNGKPSTYDQFIVTYMKVENGIITALNIENKKTRRTVYVFGNVLPPKWSCKVCGKEVTENFGQQSMKANGAVYCSGTCLRKDQGGAVG